MRIGASSGSGIAAGSGACTGLAGGELGALGADLRGGSRDRAAVGISPSSEARLERDAESADLASSGEAGALGAGVAVPRPREAGEAGAAAIAVRGEHRADAARLAVHIGADDDRIRVDATKHRLTGHAAEAAQRQGAGVRPGCDPDVALPKG